MELSSSFGIPYVFLGFSQNQNQKKDTATLKVFLSGNADMGNLMRKHVVKLLDGFWELER